MRLPVPGAHTQLDQLPVAGLSCCFIVCIIHVHVHLSVIRSLPVCKISPLCLSSKPSSRLSSLDQPFYKPRQTIPVTTDYVHMLFGQKIF